MKHSKLISPLNQILMVFVSLLFFLSCNKYEEPTPENLDGETYHTFMIDGNAGSSLVVKVW